MDCFCDYDPPEFYRVTKPRAKKPHQCFECGGPITPGERYEYVTGKWEGFFDQFTTCERCYDLRMWVKNNVPCLCYLHGSADDDMAEAIDDATWRAPEETRGLRFGFLRRKVLRDRHNRRAA